MSVKKQSWGMSFSRFHVVSLKEATVNFRVKAKQRDRACCQGPKACIGSNDQSSPINRACVRQSRPIVVSGSCQLGSTFGAPEPCGVISSGMPFSSVELLAAILKGKPRATRLEGLTRWKLCPVFVGDRLGITNDNLSWCE